MSRLICIIIYLPTQATFSSSSQTYVLLFIVVVNVFIAPWFRGLAQRRSAPSTGGVGGMETFTRTLRLNPRRIVHLTSRRVTLTTRTLPLPRRSPSRGGSSPKTHLFFHSPLGDVCRCCKSEQRPPFWFCNRCWGCTCCMYSTDTPLVDQETWQRRPLWGGSPSYRQLCSRASPRTCRACIGSSRIPIGLGTWVGRHPSCSDRGKATSP